MPVAHRRAGRQARPQPAHAAEGMAVLSAAPGARREHYCGVSAAAGADAIIAAIRGLSDTRLSSALIGASKKPYMRKAIANAAARPARMKSCQPSGWKKCPHNSASADRVIACVRYSEYDASPRDESGLCGSGGRNTAPATIIVAPANVMGNPKLSCNPG